jgi:rhodanese-related sulfurtransferase
MKSAVPVLLATLLAGCNEPAPPPAPTPPPREKKSETRPAPAPRPVVKKGTVRSIAIDRIFPLRLEGRALMIDVRRAFFYQLGHIDGAINLPLVDFAEVYPTIKPQLDAAAAAGKVIVLYCQGENCPDSHTTAVALAERGHDVCIYRGGWDEWKEVGVE